MKTGLRETAKCVIPISEMLLISPKTHMQGFTSSSMVLAEDRQVVGEDKTTWDLRGHRVSEYVI